MRFYDEGAKTGGFEGGVRTALQAMLSSLHFVFRIEDTPATSSRARPIAISDVDLASRLSFFLWGTIPDRRADRRRPARRAVTAARSSIVRCGGCSPIRVPTRSASRFAAQWLRLQDLDKVEPDALSFPYFDESLAEAMLRETDLALQPSRARGSSGSGTADGRLHVRQRAARAALRHRRRQRIGLPESVRIPTTRGAACSDTAAS